MILSNQCWFGPRKKPTFENIKLNRRFYKKFLIILGLVLALIGVNRLFHNSIPNLAYQILREPGIFFSRQFAKAGGYGRGVFNLRNILDENRRLKDENAGLLGKLADLNKLERENALLREQLNVRRENQRRLALVKIINFTRNGAASAILVNKGTEDGIKKSMAVISGGNVLAGVVKEVFDNSARVILLDDPRSLVSIRVLGKNTIGGAKGIAGKTGQVFLNLITSQENVAVGDSVITSGFDDLPEGLLVGRVSRAELSGGSLFKSVEVELFFEPFNHPELFVILE